LENTSSYKYVVIEINQKAGDMEKIKCNNHEIQKVDSFKFFGIKIVPSGSVMDGFTERVNISRKILPFHYRHALEMGTGLRRGNWSI
jgi:hypothetical protein